LIAPLPISRRKTEAMEHRITDRRAVQAAQAVRGVRAARAILTAAPEGAVTTPALSEHPAAAAVDQPVQRVSVNPAAVAEERIRPAAAAAAATAAHHRSVQMV